MSVDALLDQLTLEEKAALTTPYEEWLADDDGRALLDEAAAAGQPDLRAFGDLVHVIGNFPLMSLTTFVGMSPDHDTVEKMAATWATRHGATT